MFKNGLHDSRNGPSSGTDDVALHLTHQVIRHPDSRHISQTSGKKPADPIETEDIADQCRRDQRNEETPKEACTPENKRLTVFLQRTFFKQPEGSIPNTRKAVKRAAT